MDTTYSIFQPKQGSFQDSACKNSLRKDMKIIFDKVKMLKQFQLTVQTKLEMMEEVTMTTKEDKGLVAGKEEDLMPGFVITILKNRITSLE